MNLIELSKYLQDEQAAENYLYEKGILKRFTECPHCGLNKLGNLSRNRIKCYKCKKEWHKRKGSFLEGKQISCSKFIAFLKLYADEVGVNQITDELRLNKKSTVQLVKDLRNIIILDLGGNTGKPNTATLYEKNKILYLSFNTQTNHKNSYSLNFERYKEPGNLYSFMIKSYSNTKRRHKMNSIDRYLSFAKMKLISYRGIKLEYLKEYLAELVIKYNLKNQTYFDYLLKTLHF